MANGQWLNRSQPPMLFNGVILLYIDGALNILFGLGFLPLVMIGGAQVAGGYGIANEKKWGYGLGVAGAFGPALLRVAYAGPSGLFGTSLISLVFEIILIVLLLHPTSREYQRIWFK